MKHIGSAAILSLTIAAFPNPAYAEWPEKPIKTIVGYGAGGGTDTYARIVASLIHEELDGMPMVIINKTAAYSMVALKFVSRQKADGYTVLMQAVGPAVTSELAVKSPVNFRDEFIPIGLLGQVPAVVTVPFDSPFQNFNELVEHAKANPGSLRWANPGRTDLLTVGFNKVLAQLNLKMQDVPFKGGGPAKAATVAGQVDLGLFNIQHLGGFETKLRGLAVLDDVRNAIKDDVPTASEQGHDTMNIISPFALFVRKGTPEDIVNKLRVAVATVVEKKGYKRLIATSGLNNGYKDAAATTALVESMFTTLAD